ncbi:membrane-associated phospholipid phosphatase [Polaromonas sp. CG_9.5]|uniref:phosphatase PAP2 family protein n=1 Tax=Polaromonas sp. CG_9.5 TaxID=3071705 RepID=UPI002DF85A4F|nr:membrane-associated phospholipid phosphatase [Polaromonas sp. CG_9.5]
MELDSPAARHAVYWLATQALHAFGVALLLVVLTVCVSWRLVQRYGIYRETSRFAPQAYLVVYLALGFGLIIGAAALFAEIAENLGDGRKLGQLDLLFSDTVQATLPSAAVQVFTLLTHLGDPVTLGVLGVAGALALLWKKRCWLCAGWALAIGGNAVLNPILKNIFQRARPLHEAGQAFAGGWSFPSGHASSSVVVYGMLAYVLVRLLPARYAAARLPVLVLAAALAFTVGCSRVLIRVHFPSDVLAGFASGTVWLAVCIAAIEAARYRHLRRG